MPSIHGLETCKGIDCQATTPAGFGRKAHKGCARLLKHCDVCCKKKSQHGEWVACKLASHKVLSPPPTSALSNLTLSSSTPSSSDTSSVLMLAPSMSAAPSYSSSTPAHKSLAKLLPHDWEDHRRTMASQFSFGSPLSAHSSGNPLHDKRGTIEGTEAINVNWWRTVCTLIGLRAL